MWRRPWTIPEATAADREMLDGLKEAFHNARTPEVCCDASLETLQCLSPITCVHMDSPEAKIRLASWSCCISPTPRRFSCEG